MRLLRTLSQPKVLTPAEVEVLAARLEAFCHGRPILLLYLHGSHAQGTQTAMSDLDLAVLLERGLSREGHLQLDLLAGLEEACQRDDVDLVILNRAGPIIRDRVVRHGRLVYAASDMEKVRFEAAAIKEGLDFGYFSRVYDEALFRQLAEGRWLD